MNIGDFTVENNIVELQRTAITDTVEPDHITANIFCNGGVIHSGKCAIGNCKSTSVEQVCQIGIIAHNAAVGNDDFTLVDKVADGGTGTDGKHTAVLDCYGAGTGVAVIEVIEPMYFNRSSVGDINRNVGARIDRHSIGVEGVGDFSDTVSKGDP